MPWATHKSLQGLQPPRQQQVAGQHLSPPPDSNYKPRRDATCASLRNEHPQSERDAAGKEWAVLDSVAYLKRVGER